MYNAQKNICIALETSIFIAHHNLFYCYRKKFSFFIAHEYLIDFGITLSILLTSIICLNIFFASF